MSLLEDLNTCLLPLGIPIETGVFSDAPPDEYLVITPLGDSFGLHGDNTPLYDIQEARAVLFQQGELHQTEKCDDPRPAGCGFCYHGSPVYRP